MYKIKKGLRPLAEHSRDDDRNLGQFALEFIGTDIDLIDVAGRLSEAVAISVHDLFTMAHGGGQDVQIVGAPHIAYHRAEGHVVYDVLEVFRDEGIAYVILVSDGLEDIVSGLAGAEGRGLDDVGSDGGQGDAGGVILHTVFPFWFSVFSFTFCIHYSTFCA